MDNDTHCLTSDGNGQWETWLTPNTVLTTVGLPKEMTLHFMQLHRLYRLRQLYIWGLGKIARSWRNTEIFKWKWILVISTSDILLYYMSVHTHSRGSCHGLRINPGTWRMHVTVLPLTYAPFWMEMELKRTIASPLSKPHPSIPLREIRSRDALMAWGF